MIGGSALRCDGFGVEGGLGGGGASLSLSSSVTLGILGTWDDTCNYKICCDHFIFYNIITIENVHYCSPQNENLNLLVRIKFFNLFWYSS